MASKDIVSIILTTCCESDYRLSLLKVSMESLLRTTNMFRKELIICDNGNERQTNYLKTLKPKKHLIFGENKGITYARNTGGDTATGDYLCFIDGDLIYRPDWLRRLKGLLVKHRDTKLIASAMLSENMTKTRHYFIDLSVRWQIWSRTNAGCLLMSRQTWNTIKPWPDFWKMGAQFCREVNRKGFNFIIPTPEVAMALDYKPSYNKKKLAACFRKNEKPVWEMIR